MNEITALQYCWIPSFRVTFLHSSYRLSTSPILSQIKYLHTAQPFGRGLSADIFTVRTGAVCILCSLAVSSSIAIFLCSMPRCSHHRSIVSWLAWRGANATSACRCTAAINLQPILSVLQLNRNRVSFVACRLSLRTETTFFLLFAFTFPLALFAVLSEYFSSTMQLQCIKLLHVNAWMAWPSEVLTITFWRLLLMCMSHAVSYILAPILIYATMSAAVLQQEATAKK